MTIRSNVDEAELSCYIKVSIYFGVKTRFNLHIIPSDLDILFDIFVHVHSMSNADRLSNLWRECFCFHACSGQLLLSNTVSKLGKIFTCPMYKYTFELYSHFRCLHVIYSTLYYIYQARSYSTELWNRLSNLVNFTCLVGIVNATVYEAEPIFTGHGHGESSWFFTLHVYCNTI